MPTKDQVIDLHTAHPEWTAVDIAAELGCTSVKVRKLCYYNAIHLPSARKSWPVSPGQRFGSLTAIEVLPETHGLWRCKCDCGEETRAQTVSLHSGKHRSCGCRKGENISAKRSVHGHHAIDAPLRLERKIWAEMIRRCSSEKDDSFPNYGGRGILVCDRWLQSFERFVFDMGCRPSDKHSIDRIDVNGDYTPTNCKWSTATEQARNTRSNRPVLCEDGRRFRTITEAAEAIERSPMAVSNACRKGHRSAGLHWRFVDVAP